MCIRITSLGEDQYSKSKGCKEKKRRHSEQANKRQRTHNHNALSPRKEKKKKKETSSKGIVRSIEPSQRPKPNLMHKNPNTKFLQGAKVPCRYCRSIYNMIFDASIIGYWERVSRLDRPG